MWSLEKLYTIIKKIHSCSYDLIRVLTQVLKLREKDKTAGLYISAHLKRQF